MASQTAASSIRSAIAPQNVEDDELAALQLACSICIEASGELDALDVVDDAQVDRAAVEQEDGSTDEAADEVGAALRLDLDRRSPWLTHFAQLTGAPRPFGGVELQVDGDPGGPASCRCRRPRSPR